MLTFETDDKLKRKEFAKNLTSVILESSSYTQNKSLVIALDSPWGTGKSTFIEKWGNELKADTNDVEVITYNAWTDDDWGDALIPVVNTIVKQYKFKNVAEDVKKELKKKSIKLAGYIGKTISKKFIEDKIGINIEKVLSIVSDKTNGTVDLDVDEIKASLTGEKETSIFDDYNIYEETKEEFKKLLESLSVDRKVIFFIDELDRCRPTFAIETLEVIKHFFNVENIVFVLSLDMEQLSHSIATIYGQNMDSAGYIRRFFDLHFKIPTPITSEYVDFLQEVCSVSFPGDLKLRITTLFDNLQLTLRDMNSIFTNIKLLLNTSLKDCNDININMLEVYVYLLILKYKYPNIYKIIFTKPFLKEGNNVTGSAEYIDSFFFQPSTTIEKFMNSISNGGMFRVVSDRLEGDDKRIIVNYAGPQESLISEILSRARLDLFISPMDIVEKRECLDMKISNYIERKLEIFSY